MMNNDKDNLYVGWANMDITPDRPVRLQGQFHQRISQYVQSPVTVTVLALETRDDLGQPTEQMMIGSCDLVGIPEDLLRGVREALSEQTPGFDTDKLILNATHTHTAPYIMEYKMNSRLTAYVPEEVMPPPEKIPPDTMTVSEYKAFLTGCLCEAFREAWAARAPGAMGRVLGHAVLGHNRRVVYDDGSAQMYGATGTMNYAEPEGPEDHGVELLYFWNDREELTGVAVNPACPSQVVEMKNFISADYWGEVRRELEERRRDKLFVLPLCGAAGDQSPRDMVRRGRGEPDMHEVEGAREMGHRVADVILDNIDRAAAGKTHQVCFMHQAIRPALPIRTVTRKDCIEARACVDSLLEKKKPGERLTLQDIVVLYEPAGILSRYGIQDEKPFLYPEIHIVRLGDVAIATNPFEFFTLYGLQIKARSKAIQTMIVQLACDSLGYLPTQKATEGGHYSAYVASGFVGPEGGKYLVERTVDAINELFNS